MKLLARLVGVVGAALLALGVAHVFAQEVRPQADPPVFGGSPLLSPAEGATVTSPRPAFDWADATGEVVSYTLLITRPGVTLALSSTTSALSLPIDLPGSGGYFWTVQAHNSAGSSDFVSPAGSFTLDYTWQVFVPVVFKSPTCPTTSGNSYSLIPIQGVPADRPGPQHADLNLALRGYNETTTDEKRLISYTGGTDSDAPQLDGILNGVPDFSAVFRVNHWVWGGPHPDPGYRGSPIGEIFDPAKNEWPVTLLELKADYGAPLYIPDRGQEIYGGGYKAMVLYAEENRITLKYTREDNVINGYAVHLENICVDPNLLSLYRSQTNSEGWHNSGQLPVLRNNQPLGTAFIGGVRVAIRDNGAFMDPRSCKDWWPSCAGSLEIQRSHDTLLK